MKKKVLTINNLQFAYGTSPVLKGINLEFEQGKLYSIIGPNGCGKSTMLKNMYGYLTPAKGEISAFNKNIHKMKEKERAKYIAYVPQETQIGFDFTVYDIISMGRSPYHKGLGSINRHDLQIIENAMNVTSTTHFKDKNINELSGGEKQRAFIARALTQDTDIVLLDEPISMLDINHQIEIMDTLKHLVNDQSKTVITVLHDLNIATQYSDMIVLMSDGKVVAHDIPDNVIKRENLESVYNVSVDIGINKRTNKKIITPLGRYI